MDVCRGEVYRVGGAQLGGRNRGRRRGDGVRQLFMSCRECDVVHSEIGLPSGDRTRNAEPGRRVGALHAIEAVGRTGRPVAWMEIPHIRPVVGRTPS